MAGERNYMRIPPDSSGKRVRLEHSAQVAYTNKSSGYIWSVGQIYSFGNTWTFRLSEVYEETATSGIITVRYDTEAIYGNDSPAEGEDIVDPSIMDPQGQVVALVSSVLDVWTNTGNIVSYDNPKQGLLIDNQGSARVRFAEGNPQLDAWGKLRVTGNTSLGEYVFSDASQLTDDFANVTVNGGSTSFDSNNRAVVIATNGNPGAEARFTSHTYHHYIPGSGHLFVCTAAVSDPTASGAERNWGLFDKNNGFSFTINDQGEFGVTIRSSSTGSITNNFIPQSEFNRDKVDGSKGAVNPSDMDLELSNDNIYWIDIQWHGAGRARFGTYFNGQRVVMHEYYHGNNFSNAMSQSCTLPISYTVEDTNSSVPLQIKTWSASVWTETEIDVNRLGGNSEYTTDIVPLTAGPTDDLQPIFAFAPQETLDGFENHTTYMPSNINVVAFDPTTGEERLTELSIAAEPTVSLSNWTSSSVLATVDIDANVTIYDTGIIPFNRVFRGQLVSDLGDIFNSIQFGGIRNYAENGGTVSNSIVNITQGSPAVVTFGERLVLREESDLVTFSGVGGMTQVNGNSYYLKVTGVNTAELYSNEARTTPVDSSGFTAYTTGGTASGNRGIRQVWVVFARKLVAANDCNIKISIGWKEIRV